MTGIRVRIALTALALSPLAVGCSALGGGGGQSSASCAYVVDYDGRSYVDVGGVDYELGAELGTARESFCDDQGGGEEDLVPKEDLTVYKAYALKGVDPDDAIAVRESPKGEVHVMLHGTEDEGVKEAAERIFGHDIGDGDGDDAGGDGGSGASSAKCAFIVQYGQDSYTGRTGAEFELGAKVGTARMEYCDDTSGDGDTAPEPERFEAYEVKGLDPADVIAIRRSADEEPSLMVRLGDDLPPEVEELLSAQ